MPLHGRVGIFANNNNNNNNNYNNNNNNYNNNNKNNIYLYSATSKLPNKTSQHVVYVKS